MFLLKNENFDTLNKLKHFSYNFIKERTQTSYSSNDSYFTCLHLLCFIFLIYRRQAAVKIYSSFYITYSAIVRHKKIFK